MAQQPRKHHYVPNFYLAGFTKSESDNGELYVLDQAQRRQWKSTPANTARQTDYYAINAKPGSDEMVVEKLLGDIEGKCSVVIKWLIEHRKLPDGQDLDVLLNFVALMAVRVPAIRNTISNFTDEVLKALSRTMVASEHGWKQFMQANDGVEAANGVTHEEMKKFIDSDDYTIDLEQSWHVGTMLQMGSVLVPVLAERSWSVWIANEDAPDLICSDRPVCLRWRSPQPFPPGFGHKNTVVTIPIGKRIAIAGQFEEPPLTFMMDAEDVGTVNRLTREYANQLYSSEADFALTMAAGRIGSASDLLSLLASNASPKTE